MTRYRMNDATMTLPGLPHADWSTQSLEAVLPDETDLVLRLHRTPRPPSTSLVQHCDAEIERARRRLRGFELIRREPRSLGAEQALEVVARWQGSSGVVYTHQLHAAAVQQAAFLLLACNAAWPSRALASSCVDTVCGRFRFGWDDSDHDARYRAHDASFEVPDAGFIDRTHNHLHFGGEESGGIAVSRRPALDLYVERRDPDPRLQPEHLAQMVDLHLREAEGRLAGMSVLQRHSTEIDGAPAIDLSVRRRHADGTMRYTRQAHVAASRQWLVITAETRIEAREPCDAWMDDVLTSFRAR